MPVLEVVMNSDVRGLRRTTRHASRRVEDTRSLEKSFGIGSQAGPIEIGIHVGLDFAAIDGTDASAIVEFVEHQRGPSSRPVVGVEVEAAVPESRIQDVGYGLLLLEYRVRQHQAAGDR